MKGGTMGAAAGMQVRWQQWPGALTALWLLPRPGALKSPGGKTPNTWDGIQTSGKRLIFKQSKKCDVFQTPESVGWDAYLPSPVSARVSILSPSVDIIFPATSWAKFYFYSYFIDKEIEEWKRSHNFLWFQTNKWWSLNLNPGNVMWEPSLFIPMLFWSWWFQVIIQII